MYRLLQLSDIHFGGGHAFAQDGRPPTARNLHRAVMQALADNAVPTDFDVLVVSGDIFTYREALERTEARLQLSSLADDLGVDRIIIVPGNHDVDWDSEPADRLYEYAALVVDLGALGAPGEFPALHMMDAEDLKPLVIVALDSCNLESKTQSGLGLIGDAQLDALAERLGADGLTPATHTLIAVLHHHLLPVNTIPVLPPTVNPDDSDRLVVSVTVDATTVLGRLAELGFSLVLHGHQHVPVIMQFGVTRWARAPIHVAASGSVGVRQGDVRRQFFVWRIDDAGAEAISLRQRDDDPGRFEHDPDNSAVLNFN
jgi:3',5'-cyclic AMP phosphodiesterase CpdA